MHGAKPLPLQPKLTVNQPNDQYEQEADRVADQVMRMAAPLLQQPGPPAAANAERLQTKPTVRPMSNVSSVGAAAPPIVHEVLHDQGTAAGHPLDAATRRFMEARFGHDFSQVRVHTGDKAAASAHAISARAYTAGAHIVFGAGQYAPNAHAGRRLLAHELTHVVQQQATGVHPTLNQTSIQRDITPPGRVRFRQCTENGNALSDFAVFPEAGPNLFTPLDNTWHETDGFWWRYHNPNNEWFKIPNTCEVDVDCTETGIRWNDDCWFFKEAAWTSETPPAAGGGRNPFA